MRATRLAWLEMLVCTSLVVAACGAPPEWWPSGIRVIEYRPFGVRYGRVAVSPNRRLLACERFDHDRRVRDIVVLPLDESAPAPRLVVENGDSPQWLSDERILFYRDDGRGSSDLWVAAANGEGTWALTQTDADETGVSVAPDRRRILLARGTIQRDREGLFSGWTGEEIVLGEVLDDRLTEIAVVARSEPARGGPSTPDWSPGGERFTYVRTKRRRGFENDLYLMDADGSNDRMLVADALLRAWAPDGRSIYYQRGEIRWMRLDGSDDRRVSEADGPALPTSATQWNVRGDRLALVVEGGDAKPPGILVLDGFGRVHSDLRAGGRPDVIRGGGQWDAQDRLIFERHTPAEWSHSGVHGGVFRLDPSSGEERALLIDTEGYVETVH